AADLIDV
nr:elastase - Pseudomonas aeruginosa [Pseudomonas aeruginosa]